MPKLKKFFKEKKWLFRNPVRALRSKSLLSSSYFQKLADGAGEISSMFRKVEEPRLLEFGEDSPFVDDVRLEFKRFKKYAYYALALNESRREKNFSKFKEKLIELHGRFEIEKSRRFNKTDIKSHFTNLTRYRKEFDELYFLESKLLEAKKEMEELEKKKRLRKAKP